MAAQPTWSASTHPWIPWIFYRCQGYRQVILAVLGCFYMLATSTGKQFGQMKGNPGQRQHCFGLPHLQKTGWRGELPRNLKAKKTRTLRIVTAIDSHILNTHRLLIFIRRCINLACLAGGILVFGVLSWRRSRDGKSRLPHFLWVLNAAHFCPLGWNHLITQSGRVV